MATARPDAPRPRQLRPARWQFPDPASADPDGIVGLGADLEPETLVHAYRQGIFPWPHRGVPTPWFSPDPRGVLYPAQVHVSRSLRHRLRRCGWTTTVDAEFDEVVKACSERGPEGTWITPEMRTAYWRLRQLGWAHSVEVWDGRELVGGLYGVQVGAVFTGESMFHHRSDASKVALVDLASRFAAAGGRLIDVQITTPHLVTLGACDEPRNRFLALLADARDEDVRLATEPLPVARLVQPRAR
jgi:leucyl/phenylalanyl-tRNA---protein transferase